VDERTKLKRYGNFFGSLTSYERQFKNAKHFFYSDEGTHRDLVTSRLGTGMTPTFFYGELSKFFYIRNNMCQQKVVFLKIAFERLAGLSALQFPNSTNS
jgi:hypothetical protein